MCTECLETYNKIRHNHIRCPIRQHPTPPRRAQIRSVRRSPSSSPFPSVCITPPQSSLRVTPLPELTSNLRLFKILHTTDTDSAAPPKVGYLHTNCGTHQLSFYNIFRGDRPKQYQQCPPVRRTTPSRSTSRRSGVVAISTGTHTELGGRSQAVARSW